MLWLCLDRNQRAWSGMSRIQVRTRALSSRADILGKLRDTLPGLVGHRRTMIQTTCLDCDMRFAQITKVQQPETRQRPST